MKVVLSVILFAAVVTGSLIHKPPITTIEDLPVEDLGSRIISGQVAQPGQFPWQVFNKFQLGAIRAGVCGGALICDSWVLTAAHCAKDAIRFTLYFGSVNQGQAVESGRVELETTEKIVHENYDPLTLRNDIALIRLKQKVNFTDRIQPIGLGNYHIGESVTLTVSGWGKTSDASNSVSPVLNYVDLGTISNKQCTDVYGKEVVRTEILCCRGSPQHSSCNGDSGGPLVQKRADGTIAHVGIVSFVHIDGCASGNPSGYVRTASYIDWIQKNIGGTCKIEIMSGCSRWGGTIWHSIFGVGSGILSILISKHIFI